MIKQYTTKTAAIMKKFSKHEMYVLIESLRDRRNSYIKHRSRTNDDFAIGFFSEKINNITKLISKLCTE